MLHNTNRNHQPDNSLQNVLFSHQNQLFECYSKLLMLRVDFAYRQNSDSFNAADVNQLVADMTWLTEQSSVLSGLVGYAWVLEYTEDHRYHIHAAFYLNGHTGRSDASESPSPLWKGIADGEEYASLKDTTV